jgi:hypothetical protein
MWKATALLPSDVGVWPGVSRFYEEVLAEGRWRERAKFRSVRIVGRA